MATNQCNVLVKIPDPQKLAESIPKQRLTWQTLLLCAVLPFLSGAAALSHELLWTRRLVDLLGATDWVVGRVLGLFFFGISLGGYLATLNSDSKKPAIYRLATVEALIAILAFPAAFLPVWTDWVWPAIGPESLVSWNGALIKWLLTVLVVMPPAIAMGWTLPLFIRSATDKGANVASIGIWIYTLNTLGGVFGLWLTSTGLIYWLGAQASMLFTSAINIFVAVTLWQLHRTGAGTTESQNRNEPTADHQENQTVNSYEETRTSASGEKQIASRWELYLLSFVSGFVVLSLEVLLLRLISLVVPSSYHTTSAMLANVILILAAASGIISLTNSWSLTKNLARNKLLVAGAFFGAAIFVTLCPTFLYDATDKLISIRYLQSLNGLTIDSISHYWALVFGLVATSGGIALLFSGLVFPILLTISSDGDPAGKKIGMLLAVNGVGGLVGTELFNSVLISVYGIYNGFVLLALAMAVTVVAILWFTNRWFAVPVGILLAIFVYAGHYNINKLPYLSPNAKGLTAKSQHFGRDGVWLIVKKKSGSTGILVNNQYFLGGSGASVVQRRQLLIPWILKQDAKSVCCLGLATGITSSGLESLENPPPVTSVELSGNVVRLAKEYFKEESGSFFERQENQVIVEDARTFIAATQNQYDLIAGDLYRPYGTGEGRMYSIEHFLNVRRALTDDGLFCQWLPAYQLNHENWLTIATTFQQAFPETLVVYGDPNVRNPMIGLVGRKSDEKWSADDLGKFFKQIPQSVLQNDPLLKNSLELVVGVLTPDFSESQAINTLDNLRVEISSGSHWILKDLRRNRNTEYEDELITGKPLIEFNQKLEQMVDPVFDPKHFRRLQERIRLNLNPK